MRKCIGMLAVCSFMLAACAGESSTVLKPMQRKDKQLSCREVLLEMNEAEFNKKEAVQKRNPGIKSVIMPLGYVSTYMNAEDAIEAADARMSYLDKIYEIMQCENEENGQYSEAPRAPYPTRRPQQQAPRVSSSYGVAPVSQGSYSAQPPYAATPASAPVPYGYDPAYAEGYIPIRERFEQRVSEKGLY